MSGIYWTSTKRSPDNLKRSIMALCMSAARGRNPAFHVDAP